MRCLHPSCPMNPNAMTWEKVLDQVFPSIVMASKKARMVDLLNRKFSSQLSAKPRRFLLTGLSKKNQKTLLQHCPCLFNQTKAKVTPRGIVHLCELTLGTQIVGSNVQEAFLVQHPKKGKFKYPPAVKGAKGGDIMEMLCSEVLTNAQIPLMTNDAKGWPIWKMPGHILLNDGKMAALKAFGDILIPCGPTNIVISVKSEAARERLLYSSNSIEGVGFGFFNKPSEFWTESRMNLYKRMGFSAIYMPDATHSLVMDHINSAKTSTKAVNVNGTELYRPHSRFPKDMLAVVGKHSLLL